MIEQWTSLVFPRVYRDTNMEESSLKRGDFIGGDDDGDHSTLAGESQLALTPPPSLLHIAYHYAVHIEHDTFAGESLPGGSDRGRHPPALPPPPPHLRPSLLRPPHNTHHQGEVKIILFPV